MVVGHEQNLKYLIDSYNNNQYSHAYLFVGPEHIGKTYCAKTFAQTLLCENRSKDNFCGQCLSCRLFEAGNQPDFLINDDSKTMNVEEIRELMHFLELKPYQSKMKTVVIAHAERMTTSAANAFLKTLEEPAENTLIILTAENIATLLPTIISRTQILRFGFVNDENIKKLLVQELKVDNKKAEEIAFLSAGKIGLALTLAANPDQVTGINDFLKNFIDTLGLNIVEKLKVAESLACDKETIPKKFDHLENYYHQKINNYGSDPKELLKISGILDKIAQSRRYLSQNVNPRLVLESVLIKGESS